MKNTSIIKLTISTIALAGFAFFTAGCERQSSLEKAADDLGDAIEEVGDSVEDAAEDVSN